MAALSKSGPELAGPLSQENEEAPGKDHLTVLSTEILDQIIGEVAASSPDTLQALRSTNKTVAVLATARLYGSIVLEVSQDQEDLSLHSAVRPFIPIGHETFSSLHSDPDDRNPGAALQDLPLNLALNPAAHTKHLKLDCADACPETFHEDIALVEAAITQMDNVEIVEADLITGTIARWLQRLKSLKALRLNLSRSWPSIQGESFAAQYLADVSVGLKALESVSNLDHLNFVYKAEQFRSEMVSCARRLLLKSMGTLRTLTIGTDEEWQRRQTLSLEMTFTDWDKQPEVADNVARNENDFKVLEILCLRNLILEVKHVHVFRRTFDFSQLRELSLERLADQGRIFFSTLCDLMYAAGRAVKLRTLRISMPDMVIDEEPGHEAAVYMAKCRFIASFDSLEKLEVEDFGFLGFEVSSLGTAGERVQIGQFADLHQLDTLCHSILRHEKLNSLDISYRDAEYDESQTLRSPPPFLSAVQVQLLLDGLPLLRNFGFAPDRKESSLHIIGQAASRCERLHNLCCYMTPREEALPRGPVIAERSDCFVSDIYAEVMPITQPFLSRRLHRDSNSGNAPRNDLHVPRQVCVYLFGEHYLRYDFVLSPADARVSAPYEHNGDWRQVNERVIGPGKVRPFGMLSMKWDDSGMWVGKIRENQRGKNLVEGPGA